MTFQPYQEAAQEQLRQSQIPNKLAKKGAKLATSVLGGGALLPRVLPFLNKSVPIELAKKALNRVDPRFGQFFKTAAKLGFNEEQARDYIGEKAFEAQKESPQGQRIQKQPKDLSAQGLRDQFQSRQQPQDQAPQGMEFFAQYSPEFVQEIQEQTQMGVSPVEAALSLSRDPRYRNIIGKMVQDSRTPFPSLVRQLLGGVQQQGGGGAKENLSKSLSTLTQLLQNMQGRP